MVTQVTLGSGVVSSAGSLKLQTNGTTDAVTIDTSQNVGIGETSPSSYGKLTVTDASGGNIALRYAGNSGYAKLSTNSANELIFGVHVGGAEKMRLDQSGNLGLGVTPSAWSATLKPMEIGNIGTYIAGRPSGNQIDIGVNNYYNAGFKYANTGVAATLYEQSGGTHAWSYAASGTAGNAITFTQAMTLDASGNLLVNDTAASGSFNKALRVNGSNGASASDGGLEVVGYRTGDGDVGCVAFYNAASSNARIAQIYGERSGANNSGALTFYTMNAGSSAERARIDSSGNLQIGAGTPSGSGNLNCIGSYNNTTSNAANAYIGSSGTFQRSTSSLKYKKDVQDATHGLSDLLALRSVTYKGKSEEDGDKVFGGLIAEEVHEAGLTEFVQYAEDGTPDALAYGNMVSLCIKAIQEQQAIIQTLTERVAALENK